MKMMNDAMQHDQQQRKQALNPHESFIVQAPAGSGKTELIIQRYLTLLGYVKKPEEILAITFTKKSAHEMRARVLKALDQAMYQPEPDKAHEQLTWRLADKVLKRDRELKWNLIENPNQLHIKTIDSFCTYLTGQLPLLSHFGSQPDISGFAHSLYREAVYEILSHVEETHPWSEAVAKLLTHNDNDLTRLTNLLISLLEKRDQWQRYLDLNLNDENIRIQLTQHIDAVIQSIIKNAEERFPPEHMDELLAILYFTTKYENLDLSSSDLNVWRTIANLLLTKTHGWRKTANEDCGFEKVGDLKGEEKKINQAMRARLKALSDALSTNEGLRSTLETISKLPDAGYTDDQWEILKSLLDVLKITLAQLRVTFQTYGQIDFIENALGASLALGTEDTPTDLALSLDYQIRHILVDEFQDTSSSQHYLLKMLTHGWQQNDGRTLFVVGDPMQSIYRFRQAEVGLFIRMQQTGIGDIHLTPLTLSVNFRSTNAIVDWNNRQFTKLFPDYSDIGTGAVHFSQSLAHQSECDPSVSSVTMHGFLKGSDIDEANAVVAYAKETLAKWPNEKIAILVRSRSHLSAIVPALKTAALQYNAVEIDPLLTRQSIQDLLSLTRALIHPADRIAWLALLRAPWCGLTLSDLLKLCGNDRHRTIWEQMNRQEVSKTLSLDGQARLAYVLPKLQNAINHRERSGFRQWIEQTWLALGGPATLSDYAEISDTDAYFDLIEELSSQTQRINLELLNERMKKLHASTHYADAPIQIMTIHSSKGLEFDTVILPQLQKFNNKEDKSLLNWMEHPLHHEYIALLLAPIHAADSEADPLYRYIASLQKVKSHFEIDRLFYVAATRAKKRLHLIFSAKDQEKAASSGSFLNKLWPMIKNQISLVAADDADQMNSTTLSPSRPFTRFCSNWENPAVIPTPSGIVSQQSHRGFQLRDQSARLIGTVTHSIFQQLSISGSDWWHHHSQTIQHEYIKRQLVHAGLQPALHDHAITTIQDIVEKSLNDERGRWIIADHAEAQSEYQITAQLENGIENLIIDRTFVDADGTRWIIDYKTGDNEETNLQAFLAKQKETYRPQMTKYRLAMEMIDKRPIKMGLYFPAISAWCEL